MVGQTSVAQTATDATVLAGFKVANGTKTRFIVATRVCVNGQIDFVFPLSNTGVEKTIDHGGVGGAQTGRWVNAFGKIGSDCGRFTPAAAFVATADSPPPPQGFHVGPCDVFSPTKCTVRTCAPREEANDPEQQSIKKDAST